MASRSAYEAIRLIDPLLLNCVEASELMIHIDGRHDSPLSTTNIGQPLNSIEKSLVGALVLLLNRTDHCRHPFRDTSLEENCFKAILRGCSDLMSALIYNLSLLKARKSPVTATWPDLQNLLEVYERSLANLLGILSPARTGQAPRDFLQAVNTNNQDAARLKRLVDHARQPVVDAATSGQRQQESLPDRTQPPESPRTQPPSRQSTIADGVLTPTRPHSNCSGYKRGLKEGRKNVCDILKEIDIFEQEPPRGQRATMLLKAIDKGSVKAIELLIDLGVDLNQLSSKSDARNPVYLPLSYAARRDDPAIIELLIKGGADINARDYFGNNALLSAASSGQDKVIELLLNRQYNADIEVQRTSTDDRKGFTPLMLAVHDGRLSSIKVLLAKGAKRDVVNEAGDTLLHIAASMGRLRTTEFLLANGSQIIAMNEQTGETALHSAVRKASLRVAIFLIKKGRLLLEAENNQKQTPLALAVKLKKPRMVEKLLEKGAKTDGVDADERTPLHNAIIAKDSETIRLLVERGAKIESLDKDGRTPLYHAVRTEDPAVPDLLLSGGYKMDVKNRSGRFPLQHIMEMPLARESQSLSLLREFLRVHQMGRPFHAGYHALSVAARDGKLQHVREMLNHDSELLSWKPSTASGYKPPLHEAVRAGNVEVVKELCVTRSYALPINMKDHQGNTALHQAILSNQVAMISLLIEKGADKELPAGKEEPFLPPLHLASREQNLRAVKALLRKGADSKKRVANLPLCEKCRAMNWRPSGGNARCVLRNLDSSLRKPDFQQLDDALLEAIRAQ
ncbi:hypothetical protein H2200_013081 [Cladophialophora chaetospira]|uniref:Ankyrin n=1 Tax=Cladophialophora chaetospira TaxID=386627 RepID=A0AA39CBT0_9EURO|nr:hypothetical protein H2200_013081 [Cladophialophora chaetospira]